MASAGNADLDDLRVLIAALEDLNRDPAGSGEPPQLAATQRVAITMELKTLVDQGLHDSVEQARQHHVSWQEIGDLLGISRQAAFQRFRNPDDPRGNSHMRTKSNNALIPKAEGIYYQLQADDYEVVAQQMTFVARRALTEQKVMGVWADAQRMLGTLESLGESFVRPSGRNAVVVETPLSFEGGDLVGRIAYNKRDKIAGMLIMRPEDINSAPF